MKRVLAGCGGPQCCQGSDTPNARNEEPADKEESGSGVNLAPGKAVFCGQHTRDHRLPGQACGGVQQQIEQDIGPAHLRIREWIEASSAVVGLHRARQPVPTDAGEDQRGHQNQPGAHDDELQEVRDQHREHAAENGVNRHACEQHIFRLCLCAGEAHD